jgi:23S rRNA pseudouridine955/2504/2580 synthase
MKELSKDSVTWLTLDDSDEGQRIDNFLVRALKGVPKSHVYRILRTGEVRLNGRRAAPTDRVHAGDRVRVPPIRVDAPRTSSTAGRILPAGGILHEDDWLLVVNKPAGLAVHGGSGIAQGVIERLRAARPEERFLELVHRLDRETSGVLLLARKRGALVDLHVQIREGRTDKRYLALVRGEWHGGGRTVRLALERHLLDSGDRRVSVSEDGREAVTHFRVRSRLPDYTLVEARLGTGRTHQIRVHLAHLGHPIAGDDKYGDFEFNRRLAREGLKRMFLHAERFGCRHPGTGEPFTVAAPLAPDLQSFLDRLAPTPVEPA